MSCTCPALLSSLIALEEGKEQYSGDKKCVVVEMMIILFKCPFLK